MSHLRIDKGIPLPTIYPFAKMEIGDSFAIPPTIKRTAVSVAAMRYGDKHGMQFTVRQMPDRSYRCWRIV